MKGGSPKWKIPFIVKGLGIPEAKAEHLFAKPRKFAFDFAWPDKKLAVEYEGLFTKDTIKFTKTGKPYLDRSRHTTPKGYTNDCIKYSLGNILGWKIIRATAITIENGVFGRLLRIAYYEELTEQNKTEVLRSI